MPDQANPELRNDVAHNQVNYLFLLR